MEAKYKAIETKQLEIAEKLYGNSTRFQRLMEHYDNLYDVGLCSKHHTYDSVFYIIDEGALGYRVLKFYHGGSDIRISALHPDAASAYSEAVLNL